MPRSIPPEKWETYLEALHRGFSLTEAARMAQISPTSARAFLKGDPASSGVRWWRSQHVACPQCGHELEPQELVASA